MYFMCLAEGKFGEQLMFDASVPLYVYAHITACFDWAFVETCLISMFFLIIICFISFHFSFSKTAILRNILFMCIGGWIYSLKSRTIKEIIIVKKKVKGRLEPLTALYFSFF